MINNGENINLYTPRIMYRPTLTVWILQMYYMFKARSLPMAIQMQMDWDVYLSQVYNDKLQNT